MNWLYTIRDWVAARLPPWDYLARAYLIVAGFVPILLLGGWIFTLYQDLAKNIITLYPVVVPKSLNDAGLTGDVAARLLRDRVNRFYENSDTTMSHAESTLAVERPEIFIPQSGLSAHAMALWLLENVGLAAWIIPRGVVNPMELKRTIVPP